MHGTSVACPANLKFQTPLTLTCVERQSVLVSQQTAKSRQCGCRTLFPYLRTAKQLRHGRSLLYGLLLAAAIVVAPAAGDDQAGKTSIHHFQLPCEQCHEASGRADGDASTTAGMVHVNVNEACTQSGCHTYDRAMNHPVGVRPSGKIPAQLPLDHTGAVTCLTCHVEPDHSGGSSDNGSYLRLPSAEQLCAACHVSAGYNVKTNSHWQFANSAHLGSVGSAADRKEGPAQIIAGIDSESRSCMSCHDEIGVSVVAEDGRSPSGASQPTNMTNHPIGMDYERAAMRRAGEYHMSTALQPQIRLFNGRVGCGSCHSLYSEKPRHLVAPHERGVLCRKCHNK